MPGGICEEHDSCKVSSRLAYARMHRLLSLGSLSRNVLSRLKSAAKVRYCKAEMPHRECKSTSEDRKSKPLAFERIKSASHEAY